jgi:Uma2 family endonuclease
VRRLGYAHGMAQGLPDAYRFNPADPRAPSEEQWDRMTPAERARVVAMLPNEVPLELQPPEGDPHWLAKAKARTTLDEFFRRVGRKIYVSSELAVYYPNEPRFSPDVLAVLDVETRERDKWVVADEGRGLDLVIEVHYGGDKTKDYEINVERYARLGVREYFIFDRRGLSLRGYRLPSADEAGRAAKRSAYRPILPQEGHYPSQVLGLDLMLDGSKLRFLFGMAPVPEAEELVAKLGSMVDNLLTRADEAERRATAEAERATAEAERATAEAERATAEAERATELQRQLIDVLKRWIESLCGELGIELSPERRAHLSALDPAGLDALLQHLRNERRWP